jgi:hypothetical protein
MAKGKGNWTLKWSYQKVMNDKRETFNKFLSTDKTEDKINYSHKTISK